MWKAAFLFGFLLAACCATVWGLFEDKVDGEYVVNAAKFASEELSKKFSGAYHYRLAKVLKAMSQLDSSLYSYELDIIVGKTTCKKSEVEYNAVDNCDFQEGENTYKKCKVAVDSLYNIMPTLESFSCNPATVKDLQDKGC